MKTPHQWMQQTIDMAVQNVISQRGGPFAALIARNGELIGAGTNLVTATNDPTAHAEVVAIRAACRHIGSFQLTDCELYTSCEPCPMCLGAIYWARPARYYFASNRQDAALAGFDDAFIYEELNVPPDQRAIPGVSLMRERGLEAFAKWRESARKISY
jgi:guanine deaminase